MVRQPTREHIAFLFICKITILPGKLVQQFETDDFVALKLRCHEGVAEVETLLEVNAIEDFLFFHLSTH